MNKLETQQNTMFTCPHCNEEYQRRVAGRDPIRCGRCGRVIKKYPKAGKESSEELKTREVLIRRLAEAGFPEAQLEELGELLVIKLNAQDRSRLLADLGLRDRVLSAAQSHGFSRCALEL